jgi:hypothetical protein
LYVRRIRASAVYNGISSDLSYQSPRLTREIAF